MPFVIAQKHFREEAKAQMLDMIGYLKSAFGKILEDIDWMDPTTKSRAYDKLEAMKRFIAYPDELTDESVVEGYHAGLVIDEDDFFGNQVSQNTIISDERQSVKPNFLSQVRLTNWNRQYTHSRLRQRVDKADWRDHSYVPIVNAFYSSSRNAMIFPAGILQGLFFNHKVNCLCKTSKQKKNIQCPEGQKYFIKLKSNEA